MEAKHAQEEARFLSFPHLPDDATRDGKPALNKYSSTLTTGHDFPGAQVADLLSSLPPRATRSLRLAGNALCGWCTRQANDEDCSSCWNCIRLVGRQPLQHAFARLGKRSENGYQKPGHAWLAIQHNRRIRWNYYGRRRSIVLQQICRSAADNTQA